MQLKKENYNMEDEKIIKMENKVEIEDYTYRFEEMKESMEESLKNLILVMEQQEKLNELINNSSDEDKEYFKDFIEDTNKQLDVLKQQKVKLFANIEILKQIIERIKADSEQAKTISMLATLLNLFR